MTTFLRRFTVKPGHLDAYLELWRREVDVRRQHGFAMLRAFVETDAEPKFSWLYCHPDPDAGEVSVRADPRTPEIEALRARHAFSNTKTRPVDIEVMARGVDSRLAIMRRYSIVGSWDEFLPIWRAIVPVRARYGFDCLFAVVDRAENMFTWAFAFDGAWEDFADAQRPYYRDADRIALRGVFDYMADYAIHPAVQVEIPEPSATAGDGVERSSKSSSSCR